jgi:hypothetical protein
MNNVVWGAVDSTKEKWPSNGVWMETNSLHEAITAPWDKVDIQECSKELTSLYDDHYTEGNTLIFIHSSFTFWRNARELAKETFNLLQETKDIEIELVTRMWGTFKIKLLVPYDNIEYIECKIVQDEV